MCNGSVFKNAKTAAASLIILVAKNKEGVKGISLKTSCRCPNWMSYQHQKHGVFILTAIVVILLIVKQEVFFDCCCSYNFNRRTRVAHSHMET